VTSASGPAPADQLMARAGKTFYRAARLLPKAVRHDVVNLYAFCRTVDDLADDPSAPIPERRRSLQALATAFEQGHVADLRAAGWPLATEGGLAQAAGMLARTVAGDLHQQQPTTELDLLEYAFGVAGTVGVMMANVLRAAPEGYGAAVALGMAMQLSNICRDVAEDLRAGRVYLPSQWVPADAVARAVDQGNAADVQLVSDATKYVLAMADRLYVVAYDGIWSLPWSIRWSILAAGMCYREIGVEVGRDIERSWQRRTVVSSARKLWLISGAGLRLLLPRFWQRPGHTVWSSVLGDAVLERARALRVAA